MRIKKIERSYETCTESGWYGYYIVIDEPVDDDLIMKLSVLGKLSYWRNLKRPFFTVRSEQFLIRGVVGDDFIKAGFADKAVPELEMIRCVIESE